MAITQNTFTGNGSNLGPFSFTFKWLEPTDIKVTVGGVLKTAGTHYNLQSLNYTTKDGGQVLFTAGNAPANGASIRVYRDTDDSALSATFYPGSAIRSQDLNDNFTQNLYVTQEVNNNAVSIDGSNPMVSNFNFNNYKGVNLATPTASSDASTKGYVDSVVATGAASAAAAASSASAAAASATAAANTLDVFDDRYLGAKASDPAVDNDGNALINGAMYFNTSTNRTRIYNGSVWTETGVPGSLVRWTKTAVGGQTSLSGNDNNSNALNYTPGSEQVFLNGALLTRGVDYTATTGNTITGLVALTAGDVVDVLSLNQYVFGTVPDQSVTNAKVAAGAGIDASKLAFTQAGTGATTRTVESKLRDAVSVKDFGAVGDGVVDDTTAFLAAYTACIPNGSIFIPPGNYLLTAPLTGTKVVTWKADGAFNSNGTTPLTLPGIYSTNFEKRKLIRQTTTTATDYATVEIQRVCSHTGGTPGTVNQGLRVTSFVPAGVTDYEWAIVGVVDNSSSGGEPTAIYAQGIRRSGGGQTWALVAEYRDESGSANPTTGAVAQELDVWANGTDFNNVRVAQDIVIGRPTGVNATGAQCEAAWGSRVTAKNGNPAEGRVKKGYSVELACDIAFDSSAATVATGGCGFRMAAGQRLSFTATNDRYFSWNTGVLQWYVGGATPLLEINDITGPNFFTGIRINSTQVLTSRRTGYTNALAGTANRATAYNTSTITLQQLAERVKALQDDLSTHGLIGV